MKLVEILRLENVCFSYKKQQEAKDDYVLKNINCLFEDKSVYAIMGKSGSGKSTLLSLLCGENKATRGTVRFKGVDVRNISRVEYLRNKCTRVFQDYRLLPLLTVGENIAFPMELKGIRRYEREKIVKDIMEKVELPLELLDRFPQKLSGGEQQRVGIARALAVGTKVIVADEPTGNLDRKTSNTIIDLLVRLAHDENYCVIIATHDVEVINKMDYVYYIDDGNISRRYK